MPLWRARIGPRPSRFFTLRARLVLALWALVGLSLVGGVLSLWYGHMVRNLSVFPLDGEVAGLVAAQEMENALLALSVSVSGKGVRDAVETVQGVAAGKIRVDEWRRKAGDAADTETCARALEDFDAAWTSVQTAMAEGGGHRDPDPTGDEDMARRFQEAIFRAQAIKTVFRETLAARRADFQKRADALMTLVFIVLPMVAMLGLVLAHLVFRRVLDPIRHLARTGAGGDKESDDGNEVRTLTRRMSTLLLAVDRARSDLEESRDHLMQSEKLALVGKLAAGVAHTIRNPLTSVKMRLFSLERALALNAVQKEDFEVISEEIRHIDTIVRNFLEFSRPPKLVAQPTSLSDVVDTTLNLLKHRLESYGVTVEVRRAKRLTPIHADPDQLKEVLVNLVLNSCEAMVEGGRIVIREEEGVMEPAGRVVVVRVSDTGPGVPESIADRIFQPFFTTKGEGSGLGLAIAKRIVEEHGGWVNLHSPEGRGATFALIFPHAEERSWHRY
ncbi:sensor histidine kinase [Desulfolutivibrio sulfoxidireducens]|uniref:sensor histidine kinase n=1 Tax=Desulfolutivibrio sulfoxidireducens TaxID=2773299 RepID=UPI00159E3B38|nr:ATP-binding protein [Desulfolutivibrio sulfoxidireducens]